MNSEVPLSAFLCGAIYEKGYADINTLQSAIIEKLQVIDHRTLLKEEIT